MNISTQEAHICRQLLASGFTFDQSCGIIKAIGFALQHNEAKQSLTFAEQQALAELGLVAEKKHQPLNQRLETGMRVIVELGGAGILGGIAPDGVWDVLINVGTMHERWIGASEDRISIDTSADANGMIQGVTRVREVAHPYDSGIVMRPTEGSPDVYHVLWQTGEELNAVLTIHKDGIEIIS